MLFWILVFIGIFNSYDILKKQKLRLSVKIQLINLQFVPAFSSVFLLHNIAFGILSFMDMSIRYDILKNFTQTQITGLNVVLGIYAASFLILLLGVLTSVKYVSKYIISIEELKE